MLLAQIIFLSITYLCTITSASTEIAPGPPSPKPTQKEYVNRIAVKIKPGADPDGIAHKLGFKNKGQIGNLDDYYLFVGHHVSKRSTDKHDTRHFHDHEHVLWHEQQHVKYRFKRDLMSIASSLAAKNPLFSDPLLDKQWYFHRGARGGYDMNVAAVWKMGYTGKKVVLTILDDGVQADHPDLIRNYDKLASKDINGDDDNPTPQDNGENKHGTRCAGEIAAEAGNEYCGVGVAYNASIGGVRMLDGTVTDDVEAEALTHNSNYIDVYSASWGPDDNGKTVDGPGRLAKEAFEKGVTTGRKGLGSIFVWASGNGGQKGDNCNCDGYTNSIYTLSISSANQRGRKPWYLEECSSTLATTYSSGTPTKDGNIVTADQSNEFADAAKHGRKPIPANFCTLVHTGTSASAPIAAGIIALALEANRNLSWRDMQHIVVLTSRKEPLANESGWFRNGLGHHFSHKFGYGLMDAEAMVKMAANWKTVPTQRVCQSYVDNTQRLIKGDLEVSMNVTACDGTPQAVHYLEHVQVRISLKFQPRGSLRIIIVSPSKTASQLLKPREVDVEEDTFDNWPFMSVHFWGEKPLGEWKLIIRSEDKRVSGRKRLLEQASRDLSGTLYSWSMVFYGTKELPHKHYHVHTANFPSRSYDVSKYVPSIERANSQNSDLEDLDILNGLSRPGSSYSKSDWTSSVMIPIGIVMSIFVITILIFVIVATVVRLGDKVVGDIEIKLKRWKPDTKNLTSYSKLSDVNPDC